MLGGNSRLVPDLAVAAAISTVLVAASFLWQGHTGFSLWDEGFLWYGVQRIHAGEVPIRDFMAYDPGRYYWSAAFAGMLGNDGIIAVRLASAAFQAIGLAVGIALVLRSQIGSRWERLLFSFVAASLLLAWMVPRHKLFDVSASILLVGLLAFLLAQPSPRRQFLSGLGVGLLAVIGRNHGVYGAAASMLGIAWLHFEGRSARGSLVGNLGAWLAGVATGFLPVLLMLVFVPGFATAFWESIVFLFENKATNLPVPVPWPWAVPVSALPLPDAMRAILVGLFFLLPLLFGVGGLAALYLRHRTGRTTPPVVVASIFLALPYAHFAFSRADVSHLAQGIFPTLIGLLAIIAGLRPTLRWILLALLAAAGTWTILPMHPGWQCRATGQCVPINVSDSVLSSDPGTARDIALIRSLDQQFAPADTSLLAAPFWPGAYALLHKPSPVWEIYSLFPRGEAFERREIQRMDDHPPGFVIIFDHPLDGRDELRFRNTHPRFYQHIMDTYRRLPYDAPANYEIYVREAQR